MIFLNQRRCGAVFLLYAYVFNFTVLLCTSTDLKVVDNFYKSANVALSRHPNYD